MQGLVRMGQKSSLQGAESVALPGIAPDLNGAASVAYRLMDSLELEGSHHRRDIGYRAL